MFKISVISDIDGNEWGQFLASQIADFGEVYHFSVDARYEPPWAEIDQAVVCIILSPNMLKSNRSFIRQSSAYLRNPIIVLCGVSYRTMEEAVCCQHWKEFQTLTLSSSEESTFNFYRAIEGRLIEQNNSRKASKKKACTFDVTLIPDTIVQKANQSCVLMFQKPVISGKVAVAVLIKGSKRTLNTTQTDTKTYTFNVPELAEGTHKLDIYVGTTLLPILTLRVTSPQPSKCPCDYIFEILGSKELSLLDHVLRESMDRDYSNRLFYQNIAKRNPDFPEFPTALHFASKHGMLNVLQHLLEQPSAKEGLTIKNHNEMDCIDIARSSTCSSALVPLLEKELCDDDLYIDMTQGSTYMKMLQTKQSNMTTTKPMQQPRMIMSPIIAEMKMLPIPPRKKSSKPKMTSHVYQRRNVADFAKG